MAWEELYYGMCEDYMEKEEQKKLYYEEAVSMYLSDLCSYILENIERVNENFKDMISNIAQKGYNYGNLSEKQLNMLYNTYSNIKQPIKNLKVGNGYILKEIKRVNKKYNTNHPSYNETQHAKEILLLMEEYHGSKGN